MSGALFIAFVIAALAALGGRDQLLVARLRGLGGGDGPLLVIGLLACAISAAVAAWAGGWIAASMSDAAETMLVAFALGLAAMELLWPNRQDHPAEPTRSLGALLIVLLARQIGDGARFCIFALAAATGAPVLAGIGGALGSGAAILLGWTMGNELERRWPLRALRIGMGTVMLVAALVIGLTARGILD